VGLPWVLGLPWVWESTVKEKIEMRREKREMRREKKKIK
jgi:hypothetical protein